MAETNCQRPDTALIMETIIEESEHAIPKATNLVSNSSLCNITWHF